MKKISCTGILAVCLTGAIQADPPPLIRVIRNASSIQPYVDAKAAVNVVGTTPVSGLSENWLTELHDSFASIEALDQSLAAATPGKITAPVISSDDLLQPSRAMIGLYRPGLSYRPDEAFKLFPSARYLAISIYRVHPGSEAQFADVIKLRGARYDSINLD